MLCNFICREHKRAKMYFCAKCRKSFTRKNNSKKHVKVKYFCGLCSKAFYSENAFTRHGFTIHDKLYFDFLMIN